MDIKIKIKVVHIVGARPQFIKMASVVRAMDKFRKEKKTDIRSFIIHTGQHYDDNMSNIFFRELMIPKPKYNLGIGSSSHGVQTAEMITGLEKIIHREHPEFVFLYGDTNSTLAGAIASSKVKYYRDGRFFIRPFIVHIEAGLRSFDKTIPEEVNRVLTDHVSDLLFCPTSAAVNNLRNEGITKGVYMTGDVMYDSILYNLKLARARKGLFAGLKIQPKKYFLLTVHREENTNDFRKLTDILLNIDRLPLPVIFPVHPRTRKVMSAREEKFRNLIPIDPVSYLDMLNLEKNAKIIITDSGGVQKEAYVAGVPCITLRNTTEWVETVASGWNILTGTDGKKLFSAVRKFMHMDAQGQRKYLYGDGKASCKIIKEVFLYRSKHGG